MLVFVKAKWSLRPASGPAVDPPKSERLKRLARSLDALAGKDESTLRRTQEIGELRRRAAVDLHGTCGNFVRDLNGLLTKIELELQPEDYRAENFQEDGIN